MAEFEFGNEFGNGCVSVCVIVTVTGGDGWGWGGLGLGLGWMRGTKGKEEV